MRWIDKAKDVARSYKSNKKELELLLESQERGIKVANIASMRSGRISRPVERVVVKQLSNERIAYLSQATEAVDYALCQVKERRQGDAIVKLYEMVYRDRTHNIYGAAQKLFISESTAKRYSTGFLKIIASRMGLIQLL